jgi:hypothetical protein
MRIITDGKLWTIDSRRENCMALLLAKVNPMKAMTAGNNAPTALKMGCGRSIMKSKSFSKTALPRQYVVMTITVVNVVPNTRLIINFILESNVANESAALDATLHLSCSTCPCL